MIAYLQLMIKLLVPPVKCETYELISISGANDSVHAGAQIHPGSLFLYTLTI